jgi:UDPglucose 6-dehydrogenase
MLKVDRTKLKQICIIGAGHVGLVTGACFAELGNKVICVDDDLKKLENLKQGVMPFYEPGLDEIVHRNAASGRLAFASAVAEGIQNSEIVFICVGTPSRPNGEADLSYVEAVAKRIAECLDSFKVIVEKSTVPVKAGAWIVRTIRLINRSDAQFAVVSNPEFLREGKAIDDFMNPDRIVIGVDNSLAEQAMRELYSPLKAPLIVTSIETAELIKHACNGFLALKISYANAMAAICEKVGADVVKVAEGMGYDHRIGRAYLDAGAGYGGYCFPKDVAALIKIAEDVGYDFEILKAVQNVNEFQCRQIIKKAKSSLWNLNNKIIGILGLSYKPDTDDMREAPAVRIISLLQAEGAHIKVYDPQAMNNARNLLKNVQFCLDAYDAAQGSDALILVTEWDEFRKLDLPRLKTLLSTPVIIDGRNLFDPVLLREIGFIYQGVGR